MSTRSRTGCMTCRKRKLKCDEQKPVCGQCTKARRECVPCSGIVFRHQQNASMNQGGRSNSANLRGFYNYKNTFDENNVWVEVPKRVTFVINNDPYNESSESLDEFSEAFNRAPYADMTGQRRDGGYPEHYHGAEWAPAQFSPRHYNGAHGLEALSEAASAGHYSYLPVGGTSHANDSRNPSVQATQALNRMATSGPETVSSSNNLSFLLNPTSPHSNAIDPNLDSFDPQLRKQALDDGLEAGFELAYLLRHFSDVTAQWMDLFDMNFTFAQHVLPKAAVNPLLKYSAAALAAKQLGRVQGQNHDRQSSHSVKAKQTQPNRVDWASKAAGYCDKAMSMITTALKSYPSGSQGDGDSQTEDRSSKRRKLSPTVEHTSDDLAAATAILCNYEYLDAPGASFEWSRHLDPERSLIDIAEEAIMPPLPSPTRHPVSKERRAAFWNFARLDLLSALINEKHTRLDPENLVIWRDAGLSLDEQGFVQPNIAEDKGSGGHSPRDYMMGSAIIWLLAKIINYAVYADTAPSTGDKSKDSFMGINQMTLEERWKEIKDQVDVWHERLPSTFNPSTKIPPKENGEQSQVFPPIYFASSMLAATMQSYHMAQMLLLINRPQHSTIGKTTLFKRLGSYKSIAADVEGHAWSICGIASSHTEASVRVHSIQPLFLAGQCLEAPQERNEILRMLRAVQDDTGWETDYRVKQLLTYWADEKAEGGR